MKSREELKEERRQLADHAKDLEAAIEFAESMIIAGIAVQYLVDQKNEAVDHLKKVKEMIVEIDEILGGK